MKDRQASSAETLLEDAMALLEGIQKFKDASEYPQLESHLVAICKDLNVLAIQNITKKKTENQNSK